MESPLGCCHLPGPVYGLRYAEILGEWYYARTSTGKLAQTAPTASYAWLDRLHCIQEIFKSLQRSRCQPIFHYVVNALVNRIAFSLCGSWDLPSQGNQQGSLQRRNSQEPDLSHERYLCLIPVPVVRIFKAHYPLIPCLRLTLRVVLPNQRILYLATVFLNFGISVLHTARRRKTGITPLL